MQNFRISAPGSGVPLTALDNIMPFAGKRESGRDVCSWQHFSAVPTAPSDVWFQGVSSIGQCNTSCSLLAGVSKAKVFRGR